MSENQKKWLEDLAESNRDTPDEHLPNYNNWQSYALHLNCLGNNKRNAAKWKLVSLIHNQHKKHNICDYSIFKIIDNFFLTTLCWTDILVYA